MSGGQPTSARRRSGQLADPGRPGLVRVEPVMGTTVSLDLRDDLPRAELVAAADAALAWLHWVDATFSTYRHDSAIRRLDRGEVGLDDCATEVAEVLQACERYRVRTGGAFDARYAADRALDPSGLVKGWAAEQASSLLLGRGVRHHCVNAAGDVRVRGAPGAGRCWRIGIAHPLVPGALTTVVEGTDLAVATSGVAERGDHVIEPGTGAPATGVLSATVTGPDLGAADAYATAAVALGAPGHPGG